jgi:serine protease AprX
VGVVASAVPGSTLAGRYPGALIGDGFLRGSGTSQAAAVVSGAAALLWQKWPDLSAVQVRELLVDSSTRLGRNQAFEGHGELNLVAALARPPLSPVRAAAALALPDWRALGIGSLQAARGSNALSLDGVELRGERDIFGHAWNGRLLAGLTSDERAWSDHLTMFNGNAWIGPGFTADTVSLAGRTWNGRTWAGRTWAGLTWTGQTWTGRTWAGDSWASHGWACDRWS